jgi:hypothetical protein
LEQTTHPELKSGVDVMITFSAIFANFARKMAFFSKTNVIIKFLRCLALFRKRQFFGGNIFKILTSDPDQNLIRCKKLALED